MATKNETPAEADKEEAEGAEAKAPPPKRKLLAQAHHHGGRRLVGARRAGRRRLFLLPGHARQRGGGRHHDQAADLRRYARRAGQPVVGGGDRTQYLKVKIVLELPDEAVRRRSSRSCRGFDTFQTYLRELRPTDLDGSAGLYRLKEELTRRVNASIAPNRINAVLFKEIVVQ